MSPRLPYLIFCRLLAWLALPTRPPPPCTPRSSRYGPMRHEAPFQRAWGRFVAEQLHLASPVGRADVVEIYAGAAYATALTAPIQYLGAHVRRATAGTSDPGHEPR